MKYAFVLAALAVCSFSISAQESKPTDAKKDVAKVERKLGEAVPIVMEKDREVYGAQPKLKESVTLAELLKNPKAQEDKTIQVKATIDSVCQKRGCWMVLKQDKATMRVKFEGYKFFVPLDVAGRNVTVEGKAQTMVVTEAMRRHYALDAGKSPEEVAKIVGDETVVTFMANAVEVGGKPVAKDSCCEGELNADGTTKSCTDKKEGGGCCDKDAKDAKKPAEKKDS